jgi:mannose-1-phosphate guanylyltransferase
MAANKRGKSSDVPYRKRYAIIMAGGIGSRFWPWSRAAMPKQLLALASDKSMLADTVERIRSIVPRENIFIVTGSKMRRGVAKAIPWLSARGILCEPTGRNTAPCVGWAALEVAARDPEGVMIVLAADHVVGPAKKFEKSILTAFSVASNDEQLVTFGIKPTDPATGYGYIKVGRKGKGKGPALSVDAFVEKPDYKTAKRYLKTGKYYWNSGMFAWRADTILAEIREHLPELSKGLAKLERARKRGRIAQKAVDRIYPKLPSISVDHGIMEKSRRVAMLPAGFDWSDIGDWDAVGEMWPGDKQGNRSRDPLIAIDAADNVVATNGKPVALVGVSGLAVVDAGDALLVCPRERAQEVRRVVAALGPAGLEKLS